MRRRLYFLVIFAILLQPLVFASDKVNIIMTHPQNAPYFVGTPERNIDAEEFDTVVLKLRSKTGGTGRLFWATNLDPQMNEPKSIWFFIDRSDYYKEYVFNVKSQNPSWAGYIGQLLFFPENGPEAIEIDSAAAVPGNIGTGLSSAWREFWGPKGRLIEGPAVNNMRALTFWGQPVNFFIYGLIILVGLISFGYFFYLSRKVSLAWQNCGRITILAALTFLALLIVSQLISEYYQFKLDFGRYDFKSLEAKRALTVEMFGRDFYQFLDFCQKNLPEKARVKLLNTNPTGDYPVKRAGYFLYPIDFYAKTVDFILVYSYEKDINAVMKDNPGFRLMKKFNEGAYILWKSR
ncbi:MAG: hypothetical protein PHG97_00860 [Candidatus Margulisbacteria bacterium]|nr:hypothetical protein [Candidatus Margulisiibacteriota bacterium]